MVQILVPLAMLGGLIYSNKAVMAEPTLRLPTKEGEDFKDYSLTSDKRVMYGAGAVLTGLFVGGDAGAVLVGAGVGAIGSAMTTEDLLKERTVIYGTPKQTGLPAGAVAFQPPAPQIAPPAPQGAPGQQPVIYTPVNS